MRHSKILRALLCAVALCAAAASQLSSCSDSAQLSETARAAAESALEGCGRALQAAGALQWMVDARGARVADVVDTRWARAQQPQPDDSLATLLQRCWPSDAQRVRVFTSAEMHEMHARGCATMTIAATDALYSPMLALARVIVFVAPFPALPVAIAAAVVPHATLAAALFWSAPESFVVAPLWSSAIVALAVIDVYRTTTRAAVANSNRNRFIVFFVRRFVVRVAIAVVAAAIDCVAMAASTASGFPLLDIGVYIYCIFFARYYWKHRRPWRIPFIVDGLMDNFDRLSIVRALSAGAREANDSLRLRARQSIAKQVITAIESAGSQADEHDPQSSVQNASKGVSLVHARDAFLSLLDEFTSDQESDNMCTLHCTTGFFSSEKGHCMQLNVRMVREMLVFSSEDEHRHVIFNLPLVHVETVREESQTAPVSSSCAVTLQSQFRSERLKERNRMLEMASPLPPFSSASFPWRSDIAVQFHSPGAEYFEAVADAIAAASQCIFIADWWLSPQIYLKRNELPANPFWRLDNLLQYVAQKGVLVYIIFYKETQGTIQTNSASAERLLKSLHSNINVLRHGPGYMDMYWSHHQKFVCVDYKQAFVGGIDLCFGRYDTNDMPLCDASIPHRFVGVDYYNPSFHGVVNDELCDAYLDRPELDRNRFPRMPWQDVAVSFNGDAAYDVAMGFIQRWNNHTVLQTANGILDIKSFPEPSARARSCAFGDCAVRVVRSITQWSGGAKHEFSVQEESWRYLLCSIRISTFPYLTLQAWLWAISEAESFIYIEQQFFISELGNEDTVKNRIASAIVKKIIDKFEQRKAAIENGHEPGPAFRVVILIPQLPEGDFMHDAGVRAIMYFQSKTIRAMLKEIETKTGISAPGELILFASLRAKGSICGNPHTNQCYIHSKMLIVDDSIAIIGSANVNDRSMCGDRDSEICIVVHQTLELSVSKSKIAQFRMRLWNRYSGLPLDDESCKDAAVFANEVANLCMNNTAIYEQASCYCMPSNSITNMETYAKLSKDASEARINEPAKAMTQLEGIKGLLVMFPVHFLKDDTTLTPRCALQLKM